MGKKINSAKNWKLLFNPKSQVGICIKCFKGHFVRRNGKYGKFWGCDRFPLCTGKQKWEDMETISIGEAAIRKHLTAKTPSPLQEYYEFERRKRDMEKFKKENEPRN